MTMDTGRLAELEMRTKALEADVKALVDRVKYQRELLEALARQLADLKAAGRAPQRYDG